MLCLPLPACWSQLPAAHLPTLFLLPPDLLHRLALKARAGGGGDLAAQQQVGVF